MSLFRPPKIEEPDTRKAERRAAEERSESQRFAAEQEQRRGLKLLRIQRTGVKA